MNRNVESHFSVAPSSLDMRRSAFDRSHSLKTTFNAGLLYPILLEEVIPGDTFNVDLSAIVRMTPNVHPPMDNCYLETFFFFVPYRLVWNHTKEFFGENSAGYWTQPTEYNIPFTFCRPETFQWPEKSLWDYMTFPTKTAGGQSSLPGRAYALIFNEWFRDQNLQNPANVTKGDSDYEVTVNDTDYVTGAEHYLALCPVCKYHDYFTSATPQPQKGPDVRIPMNISNFEGTTGLADVKNYMNPIGAGGPFRYAASFMHASQTNGPNATPTGYARNTIGIYNSGSGNSYDLVSASQGTGAMDDKTGSVYYSPVVNTGGANMFRLAYGGFKDNGTGLTSSVPAAGADDIVFPLYIDLQNAAATINQLRTAFQVQKFYETMLNGSRYTEIIRNFFGVVSPDARLQRPEYLGGGRQLVNINQVVQTSSTDATSPQANVAAYSLTCTKQNGFRQSFTEHGLILGLCCVRTDHTYQQGVERNWSRRTKWDFYFPVFANLGNQPILEKELYLTGDEYSGLTLGTIVDTSVFGYQEAWAEYRYKQNRVTGQFRSNATGTLDSWHYADYYSSRPYLSSSWIVETPVNIDRTLAVSHSVSDQFLAEFYFKNIAYRVMPVYSIPGLADHH